MVYKILTVLSLAVGTLGAIPWMGAMIANIMAIAAMPGASHSANPGLVALVLTFVLATTLWPLSWLVSLAGAIAAWTAKRPALALGTSLIWLAWGGVCVLLFVLWGAAEQAMHSPDVRGAR